ncbi:hypothetical protein [Metabacillus schmidteae]|uniref:hypothetical protein n=1 Tax=Metabacillus schmidteae TaxID=2730405 RepID=UPI001588E4DB|nr:hypothetical protein [Metabacillus schmidteae]
MNKKLLATSRITALVLIAFDASYNGESGWEPCNIAFPEAIVEDFSTAVDFLGTHDLMVFMQR